MGSDGGSSGGSPSFHRTMPTLFLATPTVAATTFVVIIKCPAFKFRRLLLFFWSSHSEGSAAVENNEVGIVRGKGKAARRE